MWVSASAMSPPTAGAAAVPVKGWRCGGGAPRRRCLRRNPVAPELPPAAALAQGEHAPPDGKLSVRGEDPATSILEVAEPHRYTGAGTLSVSGSFLVRETGAVKNCSRYGQAVLVPGAVSAASGSPFQRAELAA